MFGSVLKLTRESFVDEVDKEATSTIIVVHLLEKVIAFGPEMKTCA